MRQVVEESRRPDPLKVNAKKGFAEKLQEAEQTLKDQGYDDNFAYQVNASLPPLETYKDVVDHLDNRKAVYTLVIGMDDDKRETEMVTLDYNKKIGDFDVYGEKIDEITDNTDYSNQFWKVGGVNDYLDRENVFKVLEEGFPLQAAARIEAGMEEPVSVGWFYRAPLDNTLEFGYQCFIGREGPDQEELGFDKHLEETLSKLSGKSEEKRNMHPLSSREQNILHDLEDELRKSNII